MNERYRQYALQCSALELCSKPGCNAWANTDGRFQTCCGKCGNDLDPGHTMDCWKRTKKVNFNWLQKENIVRYCIVKPFVLLQDAQVWVSRMSEDDQSKLKEMLAAFWKQRDEFLQYEPSLMCKKHHLHCNGWVDWSDALMSTNPSWQCSRLCCKESSQKYMDRQRELMELLVLKDKNATSLLLLQMEIEEFLTCKHTAWRKNEALAQANLNMIAEVQNSKEDEEMPSQHSVDLDVKTQRHVPWVSNSKIVLNNSRKAT